MPQLPKRPMPNTFFKALQILGALAGVFGIGGVLGIWLGTSDTTISSATIGFVVLVLSFTVSSIEFEKVRAKINDLGSWRAHRAFFQFILAIILFSVDSGTDPTALVMGIFIFIIFFANFLTCLLVIDEADGESSALPPRASDNIDAHTADVAPNDAPEYDYAAETTPTVDADYSTDYSSEYSADYDAES